MSGRANTAIAQKPLPCSLADPVRELYGLGESQRRGSVELGCLPEGFVRQGFERLFPVRCRMAIQNAILLADDSDDDEILFRRVIRLSGLPNPVIRVKDGEEAIAYLKGEGIYSDREKHPLPMVLMLDVKMPKKTGFEVLEWVRAQPRFEELLVVVFPNSDRIEEIRRAYQLGADSVLTKPCQVEDMKTLATGFRGKWLF